MIDPNAPATPEQGLKAIIEKYQIRISHGDRPTDRLIGYEEILDDLAALLSSPATGGAEPVAWMDPKNKRICTAKFKDAHRKIRVDPANYTVPLFPHAAPTVPTGGATPGAEAEVNRVTDLLARSLISPNPTTDTERKP